MNGQERPYANLFLGPSKRSRVAFRDAVGRAASRVVNTYAGLTRAVTGADYENLLRLIQTLDVCPEAGIGLTAALDEVSDTVLPHVVAVSNPNYVAHYHSAPMLPSLAAEVLISATNQSLDSFDQSPSATVVEIHVVRWLCTLIGFDSASDGVFTSGATQSNLMGLLLARDSHGLAREPGRHISEHGLPEDARYWTIITSDLAHFSVAKSAHVLGLGSRSIVCVESSPSGVISAQGVYRAIELERAQGRRPIALVLTAGTTDLGSIDPIEECTSIAQSEGLWVHLDAAAAGALLLSDRHRKLLRGIERVDSVSVDFHKCFFQTISCGYFAVRDGNALKLLRRDIPYLDPSDGPEGAPPNLVGKTIQTTRRFDALKVLISMRAVGRKAFGDLIDQTMRTTQTAGTLIDDSAHLSLLARPVTNTVLFRWRPDGCTDDAFLDAVNRALPSALWREGSGILGRTVYRGRVALKMTLLNPLTTIRDVRHLLQTIEEQGQSCSEELTRRGKEVAAHA